MYQARIDKQKFWFPALIFLGWTLYGVFFASQSFIRQSYLGKNSGWQNNLAPWLICAYSWALLTPLILIVANRFRFEREKWLRAFAVHIPAAAAFSLFVLGLYVFVSQLFFGYRSGRLFDRYQNLVVEEFHASVLIYFSIVAINFAGTFLLRRGNRESQESGVLHPSRTIIDSGNPENDQILPVPHRNRDHEQPKAETHVYVSRLSVKETGRIVFINVNDINWINSEGNYVKLHTKTKRSLIRDTMNAMEQKLDPNAFVRIRRSTIVRVEQITELHQTFNGEFEVILKDGTKLSASRRYRKNLDLLLTS